MAKQSPDDVQTAPSNQNIVPLTRQSGVTSALSKRERDYLFLSIFVRVQHLQFNQALTLIETLAAMGDEAPDLYLARAIVNYQLGRFDIALDDLQTLDRLQPPNMMSSAGDEERSRMRSFMKARCHFAIHGELDADGQASLDFYLRRRKPAV